jgi:hypothetical protein
MAAAILYANGLAVTAPAPPAQERLNPRIPPPIRAKYEKIRDARDWLNPIITIRAEGVEVESRWFASGRQTVAPEKLRALLVRLPVSAWPYGRVVLASDIGIRQAGDNEPIQRNHDAVAKILRALAIRVDWWPSA